jgi:molybdopterin synthase catalytic subunit
MNTIRVQTEDFDIGAECDALVRDSIDVGAIASFTGRVRGHDNLTALTIEHYPGMTEREIARHIADAETRWPIHGATVIHRVGRLSPGEQIVLVAVCSAHREPAFRAAEFLMDYLKTHAPFWKQEERGSNTNWVETRVSDADALLRWQEP